ncbi:MAG TPA: non-homologous end-joining DNA ligase [Blastocatellia bacterium]|nr:non-homologous end-joining DNA ligase [Blastocatellia bacterium]
MGLETYHKKRDFRRTPEPKGKLTKSDRRRFVVQEHHASRLHFDFRLEMGGVLKSWSVPKGPSLDPSQKRLAVPTEDHPIEYLTFEGRIPEGSYGAGEQLIWDTGTYELSAGDDPLEQLKEGKLNFQLHGDKLHGEFNLVRMKDRNGQWLLIKSRDEYADPDWELELLLNDESAGGRKKARLQPRKRADGGVRKIQTRAKEGKPISASRAFKAKGLSGDLDIKVGREVVSFTSLDKVYWPNDGYTKGDLIRYYYEVAKTILPYLKDRPLILKRYPNGIKESFFHQHDVDEAPDYARTVSLEAEDGHVVDYIVCDNVATLLYLSNLGAIERHPWHSRVRNLNHPDWFVFDLDPSEGVGYSQVCEVALSVKGVLERLGLACYAKTSGSRGMHVYVPIEPEYTYEQVAEFAEQVAALVARENPEIATVERSLKKRQRGRIYVDFLQNARGKSVVAPYSVRPRDGATVSAPLDWKEVGRKKVTPQDFTIENMGKRLARKGDLFRPVLRKKQSLNKAIQQAKDLNEIKARRARA